VKSPVENESDIRERNQYGKEKGGPEQYDRDPEYGRGQDDQGPDGSDVSDPFAATDGQTTTRNKEENLSQQTSDNQEILDQIKGNERVYRFDNLENRLTETQRQLQYFEAMVVTS
jgi:hypothetical protein